jgi:hypothetical protein
MSRAIFDAPMMTAVGVADRRHSHGDIDEPSVLRAALGLEMFDALARAQTAQDRRFLVRALRRDDEHDRLADGFLRGVSEEALGGRVPAQDFAVQRLAHDRVVRRGDDRSEQRCCLQAVLAPGEVIADLILPLPRTQRRAHCAHQRRDARRALEDGDVAELVHRRGDRGRIGTRPGKHDHGQIGPRRLGRDPCVQAGRAVGDEGLLGEQDGAGAAVHLVAELVHAPAGRRVDVRALENGLRHRAIPAGRGKEQDAPVEIRFLVFHTLPRTSVRRVVCCPPRSANGRARSPREQRL